MEIKISVSKLIENGLTESNGIILRKKMEEELLPWERQVAVF